MFSLAMIIFVALFHPNPLKNTDGQISVARGKPQTAEQVCNSLLDFCKNDKTLTGEHLDLISLSKCSKKLIKIMEETVCSFDIKVNDINLAKELSKNIESKKFDSSDIFSFLCSKLTIRELSSLYNLSIG